MPENIASQKTLINAGYYEESVMRQYFTRRNGTQTDALMFAKLAAQ